MKPNKFREPHSIYMDARAKFSTDGAEPVTSSSMCSNNNGVGNGMASKSVYSTARTNQEKTIKISDMDALVKALKENYGIPKTLGSSMIVLKTFRPLIIDYGASHHMISD